MKKSFKIAGAAVLLVVALVWFLAHVAIGFQNTLRYRPLAEFCRARFSDRPPFDGCLHRVTADFEDCLKRHPAFALGACMKATMDAYAAGPRASP